MPVAILTDSCASIPADLANKLNIEIVSYYVSRGTETTQDLEATARAKVLKWLENTPEFPKTATPGPGDYLNAFARVATRASELVTLHMTSIGSGAYQSAMIAKERAQEILPKLRIEVVDTRQVAMAHGWPVIEAARDALRDKPLESVVQTAREVAKCSTMLQTADTLKYLYAGGRVGRAKHLVGTLLNIKPIISMRDGVIIALGQARGRKGVYKKIINIMEDKVGAGGRIKVAFTHFAAAMEIENFRAMIESRFDCVELLMTELSPALGIHSGPGTVGVCFFPV